MSNGTPSVTWHARRVETKSIRTKKAMVSKRASFGRLPDLLATSMAKGGEGASTLRQRRKRGRMTCVPLALNALQSSQSCRAALALCQMTVIKDGEATRYQGDAEVEEEAAEEQRFSTLEKKIRALEKSKKSVVELKKKMKRGFEMDPQQQARC